MAFRSGSDTRDTQFATEAHRLVNTLEGHVIHVECRAEQISRITDTLACQHPDLPLGGLVWDVRVGCLIGGIEV